MILPRRQFIKGLGLLLAAPAIVRASSLMHVRNLLSAEPTINGLSLADYAAGQGLYTGDIVRILTQTNEILNDMEWVVQ